MPSPIIFGTMRLGEKSHTDAQWADLLALSHERGVSTLHVSSEYESYERTLKLLRRFPAAMFQHMVKLAEPHFGDAGFSAPRMVAKVDAYLRDLGTDCLEVVQWMWRGDLKDDAGRLAGFSEQSNEISEAFDALKNAGKIRAVYPFPYTARFADAAVDSGWASGLSLYLNPIETEMLPQIRRAANLGLSTIAIRPFAAGRALAESSPAECVRWALATPGVRSVVLGYSSVEHLEPILASA